MSLTKIKKIALVAIAASILIALIDLLTLGNQSISFEPFWRQIGQFIGIGCLSVSVLCLLYLFVSWLINLFRISKMQTETATGKRLASVAETIIRRVFGFILLIATIPLFLSGALPTIIIFLTFALYCLKSRRYRLDWEIFWVVMALLIYFATVTPLAWGIYPALKATRMTPLSETGGIGDLFVYVFFVAPLIYCSLALFLLGNDLAGRFKKINKTVWHNILPIILFLLAAAYFGLAPFISKITVKPGYGSYNRGGNYGNIEMPPSPELKFDGQKNLWIYSFQIKNNLQDDADVEKIFGDKSEIPLSAGENIKIEGAVFANGKILIKPGQTVAITILSPKPFGLITFQGKNTNVTYDFWK